MYDDRLEIVSPGGLHFMLKVEDLIKPHESSPWNPIIDRVFYRAGIIEKWGIGTLKIIGCCKEWHTPPTQWREQYQYLYIIFYPADDFEKPDISERVAGEVTGEVTGEVEKLLQIIKHPISRQEMQGRLGLRGEENFRRLYLVCWALLSASFYLFSQGIQAVFNSRAVIKEGYWDDYLAYYIIIERERLHKNIFSKYSTQYTQDGFARHDIPLYGTLEIVKSNT